MNGELTREEITRYSRHLLLPGVGREGQNKLKKSRALIIGMGGLGNPAAQYLAAAGVGTLGLCDDDTVALTNLQRQVLFPTSTVNRPKVDVAREQLTAQNPHIRIITENRRLDRSSLPAIIKDYDVVLDCTDNFTARYAVNDACFQANTPLVHGSIFQFDGQITTFVPGISPCYRCLFPSPPPAEKVQNCSIAGVLGVLPGVVGTLQATEALKILLELGESLTGRLLVYDALSLNFRNFNYTSDPNCPICSGKFSSLEGFDQAACTSAVQTHRMKSLNPLDIAQDASAYLLIDIRSPQERDIVSIAGSLHIPEAQILEAIDRIDTNDKTIVVFCKAGSRSQRILAQLHDLGKHHIAHLEGGILAWIANNEPDLPTY